MIGETDRRRRAPDPAVPDQPRGAHRDTVRAFGQPGHRHELAGHRRRPGCRRAGRPGLRRRLRAGAAARADPGRAAAADRARGTRQRWPGCPPRHRRPRRRWRPSAPRRPGLIGGRDLLPVGVDRAAGDHGAGAAAGVDPGPEDRARHAGRDRVHQVLGPAGLGILGQRAAAAGPWPARSPRPPCRPGRARRRPARPGRTARTRRAAPPAGRRPAADAGRARPRGARCRRSSGR